MQNLDLVKLIKELDLDPGIIARELFPGNKYPDLAMRRVLKGESFLNTQQVSRLSLFTGIPISSLFSGGKWKAQSSKGKHIFTNGDFTATLNTETWTSSVFHKGNLFHEEVIHSNKIPLSEYINMLNNLILKFDEQSNS